MCHGWQVQFSMIEIYNEKVRDLLSATPAPQGGMQVREDAKRGVFYGNFTCVMYFIHLRYQCTNQYLILMCKMTRADSRPSHPFVFCGTVK